jgi:hypothetical protein
MKNKLLALTLIAIISGCATPYDTKKSGWTGNMGFSETQLGQDIWQIDFTGNTWTDRDTTKKYALRKAAEIALREGYPYFKSAESQTSSDTTGSSHSNIFAGQTYNDSKTSTNMTVQLLKNKTEQTGIVYDAKFLLNAVQAN